MPGFVKTKHDEERWSRAKAAAGKETAEGSEGYWKLANYIFHKMGKTEEDIKKADELEKALKMPTSIPNPMKAGTQTSVKTPKSKKPADPFGRPSLMFKSEDFSTIKQPSIENLRSFMENIRSKK